MRKSKVKKIKGVKRSRRAYSTTKKKTNKQTDWSPAGRHNWAVERRYKIDMHMLKLGEAAFAV